MGRGRSGIGAKLGGGSGGTFRELTDAEADAFYRSQKITPAQQAAFDKYTDPNTVPGSLYNFSQEMNTAIIKGRKLTREQQNVWDEVNGSMRELGTKMTLSRFDHADTVQGLLDQLGVSGRAASMSADELKSALVGVGYTDKRILSTSVNGFKNSSNPETFTTRQFKFTYQASEKTKGVMPGVGKTPMRGSGKTSGDDFGEMLLSGKNKYKIVDVRPTGTRGRSKGKRVTTRDVDQIEIVVSVG